MDSANWETAKWDSAIWDVTIYVHVYRHKEFFGEGNLSFFE